MSVLTVYYGSTDYQNLIDDNINKASTKYNICLQNVVEWKYTVGEVHYLSKHTYIVTFHHCVYMYI